MNCSRQSLGWFLLLFLLGSWASAQQGSSTAGSAVVPRLVNFSGKATDATGRTITGIAGATFAIYQNQDGGAPLWLETQNLQADAKGNYTVQLGATKPDGLPLDLFTSGEARWLGVTINGGSEQPRVLLLSVPYALKAADAETIGGLSPSAFVLAAPATAVPSTSAATNLNAAGSTSSSSPAPPTTSNVTTSGGTVNALPLWTTATNIQSAILTQTGTTAISVGGKLNLPSMGTANASGGKNSRPQDYVASVFNSGTATAVAQTFQLQAEPANNDTANASGTLNLLYASGTAVPTETGLKIASNGQISFAPGQTFPGTGTITGVTAGTDLTGGGSSGNVTLNLDTTKVPQLNASNTFNANQTINGAMTATSFAGSGAALANVNAASLNGLASNAFSQISQSNIYQSSPLGTAIPQVLGAVNNASAAGGFNSNPQDLIASVFNSTAAAAQKETFRWQAEPTGNNTSSPSGKLSLLFGANGATPTETGLSVASNGQVTFASGQTFPGTGTITGVTTAGGSGLSGGGNNGTLSLALTNTCAANQVLQWNGSAWACSSVNTGGGTVTSVGLAAPASDFVVTGSPVTGAGTLGLAWTVPPDFNDTPNAIVKRDSSGDVVVSYLQATVDLCVGTAVCDTTIGADITTNMISGGDVSFYNGQFNGEDAFYGSLANGADGVHAAGGAGDPSLTTSVSADGVDAYGGDYNFAGGGYAGTGGTGVYGIGGGGTVQDGPGGYFQGGNRAGLGQGIVAVGGSDIGGYFSGAIYSTGTITGSKKNFKIDHPLDPANKYLVHTSIESFEDLDLYTGNVTTDGQGEAAVELPDWFEALNTDFRYQLTVVGQFAQAIISQEIRDHRFSIRTSIPNVKVSWQVTGVRHDAYVKAHPLVVEEVKENRDRGYYVNPELFGAPKEQSITWNRFHDLMKRGEMKPVPRVPRVRPAARPAVPGGNKVKASSSAPVMH